MRAGLAVKNAEVASLGASSESQVSTVVFSCLEPQFRPRDLLLVLSSKLQVLGRGTVVSVRAGAVKLLPEADLEDCQHYVLVKCGSETTHRRHLQTLRVLRTGTLPGYELGAQTLSYAEKLFGGSKKRVFSSI